MIDVTDWLHYKKALEPASPRERKTGSFLGKIWKADKRKEVEDVILNPDSGHYQRLWAVGFMKFVGYSDSSIEAILNDNAPWATDSRVVHNQVRSVRRRRR